MKMNTKFLTAITLLVLGCFQPLIAQNSLSSEQRINGKLVWEAFEAQREILQTSSAVIYIDENSREKGIYGMVVSAQGHVLTKASEIEGEKSISLRIDGDLYSDVEILGVDPQWDVVMLTVVSDKVFTPVKLSEEDDVAQGYWVVSNGSTSRSVRRVRVGVISAITREIKTATSGVILGVLLGSDTKDALKIEKVTPKSGADKAGVKEGDVLLTAGNVKLKERADLLKAMAGKKPGDTLKVQIKRSKEILELDVELMARSGKGVRMTRNDQMGGGKESLSSRRDGFPRVIHHDTPLSKTSVGGPLLTLDGICVGMNIARASRVATFAIPAREVREIVAKMIK